MRFLATLALIPILGLTGCATTNGLPDPTGVIGVIGNVINNLPPTGNPAIDQKIASAISEVQRITNQVCGFVPLAETVAGIVGTFTGTGPIIGAASGIADMICRSVKKPGARRGATRTGVYGHVRGVAVKGNFTR